MAIIIDLRLMIVSLGKVDLMTRQRVFIILAVLFLGALGILFHVRPEVAGEYLLWFFISMAIGLFNVDSRALLLSLVPLCTWLTIQATYNASTFSILNLILTYPETAWFTVGFLFWHLFLPVILGIGVGVALSGWRKHMTDYAHES